MSLPSFSNFCFLKITYGTNPTAYLYFSSICSELCGKMTKYKLFEYFMHTVRSCFNCVRFFVILWTVVHQTPLSMRISQVRILEWVAISYSKGSSQPRNRTCISYVSCTGRQVLYHQHHLGTAFKKMFLLVYMTAFLNFWFLCFYNYKLNLLVTLKQMDAYPRILILVAFRLPLAIVIRIHHFYISPDVPHT